MPVVIGGIEASLRRIAHYDYWSETIRRSILIDIRPTSSSTATPSALVEVAHRIAGGETIETMQDIRGTAVIQGAVAGLARGGFGEQARPDWPHRSHPQPYMEGAPCS